MEKSPLNYIDIFAGCGGMSLGLHNSGWKGLFAIEKNSMAFETLKHNLIDKRQHFSWPSWLPIREHDIQKVIKSYENNLKRLKGSVDLVVGGPPCQGFSIAGRRNEKDSRNKMIDLYIRFIGLVEPKIIFFENVRGFTIGFKKEGSRGESYSNYVVKKLRDLGYNVHGKIIDFSEFGIPQRRKRFILVGIKDGDPMNYFNGILNKKAIFLKEKGIRERITVEEAISDLLKSNGELKMKEFKNFKQGVYGKVKSSYQKLMGGGNKIPDSHRFPKHNEHTIKKFKYILKKCPNNSNISEEVKVKFNTKKRSTILLSPTEASPTLTTLPDDYIHYSEPRILTVREYARLQSFDDHYEFKGKYTTGGKLRSQEVPRYTQVGNAIPPLFGEQSGEILKEILLA